MYIVYTIWVHDVVMVYSVFRDGARHENIVERETLTHARSSVTYLYIHYYIIYYYLLLQIPITLSSFPAVAYIYYYYYSFIYDITAAVSIILYYTRVYAPIEMLYTLYTRIFHTSHFSFNHNSSLDHAYLYIYLLYTLACRTVAQRYIIQHDVVNQ